MVPASWPVGRALHRVLVLLPLVALACGDDGITEVQSTAGVITSSIHVIPDALTNSVGDSTQLRLTDDGGNPLLGCQATWSSSNERVARVSVAGLVTSADTGVARITAACGAQSASAQTTVRARPGAGTVTINPSSLSLTAGQTAQLDAVLRDASGAVVTGGSTAWTSSAPQVAAVDAAGKVTAVAGGAATITATKQGKSGSASVSVAAPPPPPPPPSPYPNQPSGFSRIAENSFNTVPTNPPSAGGISGVWWQDYGVSPNLSVVSLSDAPRSASSVIQTRFPAGLEAGTAPATWGGWDGAYGGSQFSRLYISMWFRIPGQDFENQLVGTKIAYLGVGRDASTALNDGYLFIAGNGSQSIERSFNLEFLQQNNVARTLKQNVDLSKVLTIGSWHHFELVLELNTVGSANGKLKWWLDGKLIMNYSDVTWIVPGATSGFQGFKLQPVWGGLGGVRTREDLMQVDHLYLSGVK